MKIMILANNDVGLYQFRRELIESLLSQNDIIISLPNGHFIETFKNMGCHYIETPLDRRGMNPVRDLKLLLFYYNMLNRVNPDLVITYTIKPNLYGGLASRLLKIPYAVNITGLGTVFEKGGLLEGFVKAFYKLSCQKSKVVFFENNANKQFFIDQKLIKQEQGYLLNGAGVNLDKFPLTSYPKEKCTTFLFVGRVMAEKGIEELFFAMKRLKKEGYNCKLHILGEYEENYEKQMKEYMDEGWLQYFGFQQQVMPFIERSHVCVLPSWHEGMANVNLEAAAMGRPVITTAIPGCQEAVEDGVTGYLCEKKNADDLYNKLKQFINLSYNEREQMGKQGRKRMVDLFDKKKVVSKTIRELLK